MEFILPYTEDRALALITYINGYTYYFQFLQSHSLAQGNDSFI